MMMNLGVPTPRAAHTMCSVGKHLLIFGGRDAEGRRNDLHVFDTGKFAVNISGLHLCITVLEKRLWQKDLKTFGRPPDPRSFHAAATSGKRLVVHGGRDVNDGHFDDLHIFDLGTSSCYGSYCNSCFSIAHVASAERTWRRTTRSGLPHVDLGQGQRRAMGRIFQFQP